MTTRVVLGGVSVLGGNPTAFSDPITVKVVLEVFERPPAHAIDVKFVWKPIWDFPVDQDLDEFEVGPLETLGKHELTLQSDPPDFAKIPNPTGPTALIISFSYQGREFLHLGYNAVVTCEGEIPDIFEDAKQLRRHLTHCFPKQLAIAWDGVSNNGNSERGSIDDNNNNADGGDGDNSDDSDGCVPLKRVRRE